MKKVVAILLIVAVVFAGLFIWAQVGKGNAQKEVTDLTAKLGTQTAKANDLEAQIKLLQDELETAKSMATAAGTDLTAAGTALENANTELADTKAALEKANAELTDTKAALEKANAELTDAKAALESANTELANTQNALNNANVEISAYKGEEATLSDSLNTVKNDLTAANDELTAVTGKVTAANTELETVTGKVTAANTELETVTGKVTAANDELTAVNAKVAAANTELETVNGKIAVANDELAAIEQKIAEAALLTVDVQSQTTTETIVPIVTGPGPVIPDAEKPAALEKVSIMATYNPHAEILELIKDDMKALGYELDIIPVSDYVTENPATAAGDVQANFFQHVPYLAGYNENASDAEKLTAVVFTHFEPMAIYPGTKSSLDDIASGDHIAIPNDPVNETRALLLLQSAGLIALPEGTTLSSTCVPGDIIANPHGLKFDEVNAELIPGVRQDVAFAVINGNNATLVGLVPYVDGVFAEQADSEAAKAYVNIVVVKPENAEAGFVKALETCVYTQKVYDLIVNAGFAPTFAVAK